MERGTLTKLLTLARRYRHVVTSVSAAIVLAAFLIKDVIREDTRQRLDTIDSAAQEIRGRSEMRKIDEHLGSINTTIIISGSKLFDIDDTSLKAEPRLAKELLHARMQEARWASQSAAQIVSGT